MPCDDERLLYKHYDLDKADSLSRTVPYISTSMDSDRWPLILQAFFSAENRFADWLWTGYRTYFSLTLSYWYTLEQKTNERDFSIVSKAKGISSCLNCGDLLSAMIDSRVVSLAKSPRRSHLATAWSLYLILQLFRVARMDLNFSRHFHIGCKRQ
jgi:hypothetical protein